MKKLSQKGFSTVEIILVLVLLGLVGFIGYYVYSQGQKQDQTSTPQSSTSTQSETQDKEVGSNDNILDPTDLLEPYKLPKDWTHQECHEGIIAINPPKTDDPNCKANQPSTVITMSIVDNTQYLDPESCAASKAKFDKSYEGFESYSCEDITVDGKKGIRQVVKETEEGFSGKATYTTYLFPTDGQLFSIGYNDIASHNYPDYTDEFDAFVQTLKFQ